MLRHNGKIWIVNSNPQEVSTKQQNHWNGLNKEATLLKVKK